MYSVFSGPKKPGQKPGQTSGQQSGQQPGQLLTSRDPHPLKNIKKKQKRNSVEKPVRLPLTPIKKVACLVRIL